jgi:hypothetical protein
MRRFALVLGLGAATWTMVATVSAEPSSDDGESAPATGPDRRVQKEKIDRQREARQRFRDKQKGMSDEEKLEKRRERLERAAIKLRERAKAMREQAAAGGKDDGKGNTPEKLRERADKFEAQAKRMDERAKNVSADPTAGDPDRDRSRSPQSGRDRLRKVRRAQLRRRWGKVLDNEAALAELKTHARRTARLKQIRKIARKAKQEPVSDRAAKLLAQEKKRHEERMRAIQATIPGAADEKPPSSGTNAASTDTKEDSQ